MSIQCPLCKSSFKRRQNLVLHLVHRHDRRPSEAQEILSLAGEGEQITDTILDKADFLANNNSKDYVEVEEI